MTTKIGDYELNGRVLYNQQNIAIAANPRTVDEHDLVIGRYYQYLGRGILKELATAGMEHFQSAIEAMGNELIEHALKDVNLRLEDLRFAFSQARIKELEEMLNDAIHDAMNPGRIHG